MRTGNLVTLEVAKQGAIYHGLAALLAQPSPVLGNNTRDAADTDFAGYRVNLKTG